MIITAYLLCSMLGAPVPAAWMRALAEIETGGNPNAVGRHGEVTEFQVLPRVWREHSQRPLHRCGPNERAAGIKEIWARRINAFADRHGRRPTPREAYLLWHRPARVLCPRPNEAERARRFENVVGR